jgi:ribosome biogenesis GTPase
MDRQGIALVLRVDRKRVVVELPDGRVRDATLRGSFHRGRGRLKSPVAVGDHVRVDEPEPDDIVIAGLEKRSSVLLRPEIVGRWRNQVLVANADRAVLVFAHADPVPRTGLVDRLLVACHAGHVPPVLVFNKSDLEPSDETRHLIDLYERLGYELVRACAESGEGVDRIVELLRGRNVVFAGPSGTGKSSLINRALPGVELRTGEISRHTGKGRHTTTAAQLVRIPGDSGHVIDTPGIKEFGLVEIPPRDLELNFPEFPVPGKCRFLDCAHRAEPGCEVVSAVSRAVVAASRYESYLTFRDELEEAGQRR